MKRIRIVSFIILAFGTTLCTNPEKLKKERSISHGLVLYNQHCVQCHGSEGTGLGTLYPPLASSDFLLNNPDSLACFIKWGKDGPLEVNGIWYDQPMPSNPKLLDQEISHLVNYIQNAWGNKSDFYSVDQVKEDLLKCD